MPNTGTYNRSTVSGKGTGNEVRSMSVEIIRYVKIVVSSLEEPLQLTVAEATELRDALISAIPVPSKYRGPQTPVKKWVLTRRTWRKGSQTVSVKSIKKVLNVIGKDWRLVDDLCEVTGYSRPMFNGIINVMVQERKMLKRGWGKDLKVRLKTIEYKPTLPDVPKVEVVNDEYDLSALTKEQKEKRDAMRMQ